MDGRRIRSIRLEFLGTNQNKPTKAAAASATTTTTRRRGKATAADE